MSIGGSLTTDFGFADDITLASEDEDGSDVS